jgi:hypothetical protein
MASSRESPVTEMAAPAPALGGESGPEFSQDATSWAFAVERGFRARFAY